ncbi:putative permease [Lachnellula subtilissima]|uniref:Putative permease n=1 Tax=Lachnellula subtilissima TaxID=602034 RepID=A0A8H8UBH5_9HELO|nr:putative permease [Lachnellula subtilissima]
MKSFRHVGVSGTQGWTLIAFFGVFIVSASQIIYGKILWDPIAILDGFLTQDYDSKTRCGVFFLGLGFSFAQVTTMIFANLISAGNDTAALVPRFLDVKRGAIIRMILVFAITPWNFTRISFAFTNYLNNYSVFLSGFVGIIAYEYFVIRKGYIDIRDLFSARKERTYCYSGGWNWRALAAYFKAMAPFMPLISVLSLRSRGRGPPHIETTGGMV